MKKTEKLSKRMPENANSRKALKSIAWKEGQKAVHNLPGKRGIRMDFCVEDIEGNLFDVEMQKRNEGNIPKRTRFYQALVDAPMLKSGEKSFDGLKPLYLIIICGFDLYQQGKYRYTFENFCEEIPGLPLGDECKKIILNTCGKNDYEVERSLVDFLHYVEKTDESNLPEGCDERLRHLHKKVTHIKSSGEVEVTYMKMEERDRLLREEGREKELIRIVCKFLKRDQTPEEIADFLETDIEEVREICAAAEQFAPDYNCSAVYTVMRGER